MAVSSGPSGLHTAISYFIRNKEPYVLVPTYTWYAVAASVINAGGIPLFFRYKT
jgi:dTDP-4-amino-4,6-dideoxygalactose transaminase